ncbi:MAG: PQQ-binding-like beta-propeller repeat protein [Planctomycetaceae bacterium]
MYAMRFCLFAFALFVGYGPHFIGAAEQAADEKEQMTPVVSWSAVAEFVENEPHNPLFVDDLVIVGTDKGEVRAYDGFNGRQVWTHHGGKRIFHRLASDSARVYFTSDKGLAAVNLADGRWLWSFSLAVCDGPTLALPNHGLVYVGGHDGKLYAVDAKTGEQRWTSDFLADAPPDPPGFDGNRARGFNTQARPSALASDGETIILSVFDQCRVIAINAADGKRLWSFQTGGWILGTAVATETRVFIGSQDKFFYCLDKQTGEQLWKFETNLRVESGGTVDDKYVYFGSCDGHVYCVDQTDGGERWRFEIDHPDRRSAIYSVPVLQHDAVHFATGEGQVYAINQQTGELRWKLRPSTGSELYCSPATNGDLLYVTSRARSKEEGAPSLMAIGRK